MSDPTTSGGTPAAPAATPTETATPPAFGTFGTSRGTGLARGKRPTPATAQPASATADYQPSTIAVLRPKSEYVNPFTGETSVGTPTATPARAEPSRSEPVARILNDPAIAPAAQPVVAAPVAVQPSPMPAAAQPAPVSRPSAPAPEAPPRLNILPPEQAPRASHSWESPSATTAAATPREAREPRNSNSERYPRRDREGGDARPIFRPDEQAARPERRAAQPDPRPARPDIRAAKLDPSVPDKPLEDKSPGFFGWLISLFGGGKKSSAPKSAPSHRSTHGSGESARHSSSHGSSSSSADGGSRHEGGERRRRRRGGRGRSRHREGHSGGEHAPRSEGGESSSGHHRHESGGHGEGGGRAAS